MFSNQMLVNIRCLSTRPSPLPIDFPFIFVWSWTRSLSTLAECLSLSLPILVCVLTVSCQADRLFEIDRNDPIRVATQAVGIVRYYKPDSGSFECAAAVLSDKYLVTTPTCADVAQAKRYGYVRADFRIPWPGLSYEGPLHSLTENIALEPVFQVKFESVKERSNLEGFGLLEVIGNPSIQVGTVKILNRSPVRNEQLFSVSDFGWDTNLNCQVTRLAINQTGHVFTTNCGGTNTTFLFAKSGYGLLGIYSGSGAVQSVNAFISEHTSSLTPIFVEAANLKTHASITRTIIECYKAGNATIADMYACAGVWVTPRIFTLCFLEANCPVIKDEPNARSLVEAALGGPGKLDTKISIDMNNVLSLPDRKIIDKCIGYTILGCVGPTMSPASLQPLRDCAAKKDDYDKAACLAEQAPTGFSPLLECMSTKGVGAPAFKTCATGQPWSKVDNLETCVRNAPAGSKVDCFLDGVDPEQKALALCLSNSSNRGASALDCLSQSNPQLADKLAVASCAIQAADSDAAASCFTNIIGGEAAKIANCAKVAKQKMVTCLLGDKPEYKAAAELVACVQGGRDASSLVANCSDFFIKDSKVRATLACVTQAGSDTGRLASCAAFSVLPPEFARYAGCATTSQGATSFAICAAGPYMNEEWRIAAECAVQTGGNPVGFAGCTAGRLTLKELTQCFSGGSCFGPNNTIVKFYSNAFDDVMHGPGPNNDIIVAFQKLGEATGGPNSVINDPGQVFGGENSVFHKPAQIFGGDNSVLNVFFRTPLGGDCSVFNSLLGKCD